MSNILVIRGGALGDFLLTLPVLAALRANFPGRPLELLADPRFASLAIAGGLAGRVSALDSPALSGFFARDASRPPVAGEYFARFELIISYLYDPEQIFKSNVSQCTAAKWITGPHRPDESAEIHATDLLLRPLEELNIRNPSSCPRLTISASPNPGKARRLALHPGSGSEQKNWPEPKWRELLQHLVKTTNWHFLLIAGEAEGQRCRRLADEIPSGRAQIAQSLPLVELAQQMKASAAFIGHDSGITHLAAALDIPGLALWGNTSEKIWRPRCEKITLLRDPGGLAHMPVESVLAALSAQAIS